MDYLIECTKWFAPADEIAEALRNNEGLMGLSHDELKMLVMCDDHLKSVVDTLCQCARLAPSTTQTERKATMTPSELKYHVESNGHESYFFDRKSMKFFGDTMRNYGVCKAKIVTGYGEERREVEVWELYRKRPVKHGLCSSTYFDTVTFRRVFESKE